MARKGDKAEPAVAPPSRVDLVYVGPPGQSSPDFGELVAGERYSAESDFATYLVEVHPDYWARPASAAAQEAVKQE